jgi:hypothetical protein
LKASMPVQPRILSFSLRIYRRLLFVYPADHRSEFGSWMAQTFQDLSRQSYRRSGWLGLLGLWLRLLPDLWVSALVEHASEWRSRAMKWMANKNAVEFQGRSGFLFAVLLVAAGLVAKIWIVETGGSIFLATALLVAASLAGAVWMDYAMSSSGMVTAATTILIGATLLPLLWVGDGAAWLRENPVNALIVLIAGLFARQRSVRWPVFAVALILSAAMIWISFL